MFQMQDVTLWTAHPALFDVLKIEACQNTPKDRALRLGTVTGIRAGKNELVAFLIITLSDRLIDQLSRLLQEFEARTSEESPVRRQCREHSQRVS